MHGHGCRQIKSFSNIPLPYNKSAIFKTLMEKVGDLDITEEPSKVEVEFADMRMKERKSSITAHVTEETI